MNPLRVPELLHEIAGHLGGDRPSFASLSQVDRFTHGVARTHLFRDIAIGLESAPSLALALRSDPTLAALCRSLSFHRECRRRATQALGGPRLIKSGSRQLQEDVAFVLRAILSQRRLITFVLCGDEYGGSRVDLSEDAWAAIGLRIGFVKELKIFVPSTEENVWSRLMLARFSQLRIFHLDLSSAHQWECSALQTLLDTLGALEDLSLCLPPCCGLPGMTLRSTHPRLKRFSFTSSALTDESTFLARHPSIETLFLDTEQVFQPAAAGDSDSESSLLRSLYIDDDSLFFSPSIIRASLIHLHLWIHDNLRDLRALTGGALSTIRCLEIEFYGCFGNEQDHIIAPTITALVEGATGLDELAILCHSASASAAPNAPCQLLEQTLKLIPTTSSLRALRLRSVSSLPQERLADLGPLPTQLRYIGWDSEVPVVYVIERDDDRNFVSETLVRLIAQDWTEENVLHRMGESWTK
ncbi:hypothetical protein R3P38DRAFT_2497326 [Favolaschia claudopus]|uniref:Proteophosphoglycan 5 n=1 Tax=Favolaschia claudopus TaxID=2862362 RepID=A0AAW0E266_9AGAR